MKIIFEHTKKTTLILGIISAFLFLISCDETEIPLVSLGIENVYIIPRMQAQGLYPAFTGERYEWRLSRKEKKDSILSTEKNYIFLAQDTGKYHLIFEIFDSNNPLIHELDMHVVNEQVAYSPYIHKVYEYKPAPGQFVNCLPEYVLGDTENDMIVKTQESISGTNQVLVSLGAYGGYLSFGFDHTVINVKGESDFSIDGNAFYAASNPNPDAPKGGSSEPGIVMVAFDKNQNGKPDEEEWYELAGSEYYKTETIKKYKIKYIKPEPDKIPTPDPYYSFITDSSYIAWETNQGTKGHVYKNKFHNQPYYPLWIESDELVFEGTKLLNNAFDEAGDGSYFVQYSYGFGYADNKPNKFNVGFNIEWAVDKNGNHVDLPGADFIRVYTSLNQYCGWLGETSTEISGGRDLHIPILPFAH
ncbi:MAG: cell surface protein [Bacteroidetes bacterium]|nr:cell surface protein [Bacteroidota bacterium]